MGVIGNFTTGTLGNYRIDIPILAGSDFDRWNVTTVWIFGQHRLSFHYPYLNFTTFNNGVKYQLTLNGVVEKAWWYYEYNPLQLTNRIVTVIHDVTNQRVKFYCDDYLIGNINCNAPGETPLSDYSGTYQLSTNDPYPAYHFDGFIGTPTFINSNLTPTVVSPRVPAYRVLDNPGNYVMGSNNWAGADDIQTQYSTFQVPAWPAGIANSFATGRAIDLKLVAGYPGSGTITQQVIDDTIWLQDLLANYWGWVYDVTAGSVSEFYENKDNPLSIANQLITWALANPPATGVYEAVTGTAFGFDIAPYTWYDFSNLVYGSALSLIDGNVQIYRLFLQALFAKTGDLNMRIIENGEQLNADDFSPAGQPQATQKFSDFYNYLRSLSDQVFSNTYSQVYRVYDHRTYNLIGNIFVPFVTINGTPQAVPAAPYPHTNGMGSIQQYILTPDNWRAILGNQNGFEFYYVDKRYELSYGYQLNTPFTGLGAIVTTYEDQILCCQGLAFHCLLKVMGAKGFYASNFSNTDPRQYFYMCFVAPYIQAACNGYEIFLDSGVLLPGDTYVDNNFTIPTYVYWSGTKSVPVVARKLGTDQYMIGYAYMVLSNYDDQADTYDFDVTIDGHTLSRTARRCGDIEIYNSTTNTSNVITSFFELTHFQWWSGAIIPDTTPPIWDQAYTSADVILACADAAGLATALAFTPTATDVDSPPATVVLTGTTGAIACGSTYTRTWRATDAVGNHTGTAPYYDFVQIIQILSAVDTTAPVITNTPGSADVTLECNDTAGLALALSFFPVATDDFDPAPMLNVVSDNTVAGVGTILYVRTRIWNYSDVSGNISSNFTQVITVQDTIDPTWVTVAGALDGNFVYTNTAGIALALAQVPVAIDECAGVTVNLVSDSGVGVVPYTRTRTWEAVDDVGNISTIFTQTILIINSSMGLIQKYGTSKICTDELTLRETTGTYDDPLNIGGYGTPNPDTGDVTLTSAYLYVPDSDFQLSTSYIDISSQFASAGFPSSNTASEATLIPSDVGLTEFPQGWYQLIIVYTTLDETFTLIVNMYNDCDAIVDMATYNEAITAQLLAGTCKCSDGIPNSNCVIAFEYLQVSQLWAQGEYAKAMEMLKLLQDTLDNLLNTDC